jgi:hypothetical protein
MEEAYRIDRSRGQVTAVVSVVRFVTLTLIGQFARLRRTIPTNGSIEFAIATCALFWVLQAPDVQNRTPSTIPNSDKGCVLYESTARQRQA